MPTPGGGIALRNPYAQAQQAAANQTLTANNPLQAVAAVAAQRTVSVVQQSQTLQAPQAAGQTEASREGRPATETGRTTDAGANVVEAIAGRPAAARQGRGRQVDVLA